MAVTHEIYHERDIPNIQVVFDCCADRGHPEAYRLWGNLMARAGATWRIRKGYDVCVVNLIYDVEIDDPDLWAQFRET